MAWKLEPWSTALGTSFVALQKSMAGLADRETVIVACALIDTGLAELLAQRLTGRKSEIEEFLGAQEDGRAPAGSFGARILLARLTGILESEDVALLRALKSLRNDVAHRTDADLCGKRLLPKVETLHRCWSARGVALGAAEEPTKLFRAAVTKDPRAARLAVLRVLAFYQRVFQQFQGRLARIGPVII